MIFITAGLENVIKIDDHTLWICGLNLNKLIINKKCCIIQEFVLEK